MFSKSDNLPKHNTETPNVGGAGELSIEDGLGSHPSDWDGSSAIREIVVCRIHVSCQTQVSHFDSIVPSNHAVSSGKISLILFYFNNQADSKNTCAKSFCWQGRPSHRQYLRPFLGLPSVREPTTQRHSQVCGKCKKELFTIGNSYLPTFLQKTLKITIFHEFYENQDRLRIGHWE